MLEPQHSSASAEAPSSSPQLRSGWGARMAPVVPIVLALGVALVVRRFWTHAAPPPPDETAVIGSQAPGFSLIDARNDARPEQVVTLAELVRKGPVVIVFHSGLQCPVCAQNLLTYGERMEDFKKAGIQVVAISPQAPEETRASMEVLGDGGGAFGFPLLWDSDEKVARAYGVETADGGLMDGTFVIDGEGRIQLAEVSNEPFGDISKLIEVATRAKGRQ